MPGMSWWAGLFGFCGSRDSLVWEKGTLVKVQHPGRIGRSWYIPGFACASEDPCCQVLALPAANNFSVIIMPWYSAMSLHKGWLHGYQAGLAG